MIRNGNRNLVVGIALLGMLAGVVGCGGKKELSEHDKSQSIAPNDSMQKAYSGNRPGASAQTGK